MSYFYGHSQPEAPTEADTRLDMDTSTNAADVQSHQPAAESQAQARAQAQTESQAQRGSQAQAGPPAQAGGSGQPQPSHHAADPADDARHHGQQSQTQPEALAG